MLKINTVREKEKILDFLRNTFKQQKIEKAVVGLSGGIDSTVSLYLLKEAIGIKNVITVHLPYSLKPDNDIETIVEAARIPPANLFVIPITDMVDTIAAEIDVAAGEKNRIRAGNIMARVRMIVLYDFAKRNKALVCGTENKSEHYLGYFTRFGDAASDIEPIVHLYKTQVYQLAKYLGVPQAIIDKSPTAGLWHGQTDEAEFGFSYDEADNVMYLHFEKKLSTKEIEILGYRNAQKILQRVKENEYKNKTPYLLQ